jgi:hypothetical protein
MQDSFLCVFRIFTRTSTLQEAYGTVRLSEVGANTASIAPDFTAALHFTLKLLLSALRLYFFFSHHVFLSLHKKMVH